MLISSSNTFEGLLTTYRMQFKLLNTAFKVLPSPLSVTYFTSLIFCLFPVHTACVLATWDLSDPLDFLEPRC